MLESGLEGTAEWFLSSIPLHATSLKKPVELRAPDALAKLSRVGFVFWCYWASSGFCSSWWLVPRKSECARVSPTSFAGSLGRPLPVSLDITGCFLQVSLTTSGVLLAFPQGCCWVSLQTVLARALAVLGTFSVSPTLLPRCPWIIHFPERWQLL